MASNLECRVFRLEQQLQLAQQQIAGMLASIAALQAQQWTPGGGSGGGGGGSNGFYVAMPAAAVTGATWSAGAPTAGVSFTAPVWQVSSASILSLGDQTCVNWLAADLVANQGVVVIPDGAGSFGTASQSCV